MKKGRKIIKSSIQVGALTLFLSANGWTTDGKLTEISRPYLGTYECEYLCVGDENKLESFDYIRIELLADGELKLSYREKEKDRKSISLAYDYDEESKTLIVSQNKGIIKSDKKLFLENGEINLSFALGKYTISAKFKK